MKKQKKHSAVVKDKKEKKPKNKKPVQDSIEEGIPGEEDVLLDQVAQKNHPEYPDME